MTPAARRVLLNVCARQILQLERKRYDLEGATLNPQASTDAQGVTDLSDASLERQLRFWQDMTTRYQEAQPA